MGQKIFIAVIVITLNLWGFVPFVFAQTVRSDDVITQVGNPTDPKPIPKSGTPGGGGGNQDIVQWADEIAKYLVIGSSGYLSFLTQPVSNGTYTSSSGDGYVCTIIVMDAYNLAGITGLDSSLGLASAMQSWWRTAPSPYSYLDYDAGAGKNLELVKNVKPGFTIFWGVSTGANNHVAIVTSEIDWANEATGDGILHTVEANNVATHIAYEIVDFVVRESAGRATSGFGGIN